MHHALRQQGHAGTGNNQRDNRLNIFHLLRGARKYVLLVQEQRRLRIQTAAARRVQTQQREFLQPVFDAQAIILRRDQHQIIVKQAVITERFRRWHTDKPDLQRPALQHVVLLRRGQIFERDVNAGILRPELRNTFRRKIKTGQPETCRQKTFAPFRHLFCVMQKQLRLRDDFFRFRQQPLPARRQRGAVAATRKQRQVYPGFQQIDLFGERRLRYRQRLCCQGVISFFCQHHERLEQSRIHYFAFRLVIQK